MTWSRPLASTLRAGFEVTGYALNRTLSTWAAPRATAQQRSGFEITGYALAIAKAWAAPRALSQNRAGFEITGYAMTK